VKRSGAGRSLNRPRDVVGRRYVGEEGAFEGKEQSFLRQEYSSSCLLTEFVVKIRKAKRLREKRKEKNRHYHRSTS
jgi:hypothetical protein